MIIAIDFDGTCVTHEFPHIGDELPGCSEVLKELVAKGHKLILWTMRSDMQDINAAVVRMIFPLLHTTPGKYLTEAVDWFTERGIQLWGINCNRKQHLWTDSPKAYADIYIDDRDIHVPSTGIDWGIIRQNFIKMGVL